MIETPLTVLGLAAGLILVKMLCLIAVARVDTANWRTIRGTAVALSQGCEFAFVILGVAVSSSLMDGRTADMLIVAVTLSMAATPLAFKAGDWLNARLEREAEPAYERHIEEENRVIIAGFGRVGQIVGRILRVRRIGFTALETSAEQVDFVRRFGNKIYYGDASGVELLRPPTPTRPFCSFLRSRTSSARLRRRGRFASTSRTVMPGPRIKPATLHFTYPVRSLY